MGASTPYTVRQLEPSTLDDSVAGFQRVLKRLSDISSRAL
jgi:hypothetical protein